MGSYEFANHITSASVVNTILSTFGVSQDHWLRNDTSRQASSSPPAKLLKTLIG